MRSFMTSRSLTWGAELDEEPDGSDMTPFPKENAVMMVYRGPPPPAGEAPHVERMGTPGLRGVTA
jgi:hypothetical protein